MLKTQISLEKVQKYYEEQRMRLEAELERREGKRGDKENVSPLSEGPLSTTPSSALNSSSSLNESSTSSGESEKRLRAKTSSKMTALGQSRTVLEKSRYITFFFAFYHIRNSLTNHNLSFEIFQYEWNNYNNQ